MSGSVVVQIRFIARLNDFLPGSQRNKTFSHLFKGNPSIKDAIESLGVPHTEVACIVVNRLPVNFSYKLQGSEKIVVYPSRPKKVIGKIRLLKLEANTKPEFVLDSHLGKLTRYLRLLGFDAYYKNIFPDPEIVDTAVKQNRIVLTRDIGLLKHKRIRRGYWLRSLDPRKQLKEVIREYDLKNKANPFSRCLECNGPIRIVARNKIWDRLAVQTRKHYRHFKMCKNCKKIYWQGSHYQELKTFVERMRRK